MSLSEVSNAIWRERQLLELLVFKLAEEQFVIASGREQWLPRATREVETVLAEIKSVELDRAMTVAELADELGLEETPSLRDLAASGPAPWDAIYADHRRALLELAHEVDTAARANRDLLRRRRAATREALVSITEIDMEDATLGAADLEARTIHGRPAQLDSVFADLDSRTAAVPSPPAPADIGDSKADAVMELQMQEMSYQAALHGAERSIQPSLVDFLR
jgi:hypothetical protein